MTTRYLAANGEHWHTADDTEYGQRWLRCEETDRGARYLPSVEAEFGPLAPIVHASQCPNCAPGYDCERGIYTPAVAR